MTMERSSFDDLGRDPGLTGSDPFSTTDATTDALVGTREDELTGLSDAPFPAGVGTSTPASGTGDTGSAWATDPAGSMYGSTGTAQTGTTGSDLGEAASGIASRLTDTAGSQLTTQVNSQMTRGADMLVQVSDAIRKSGEQIRGEQPQIADFADTAATQVDKAGQFLRQNDLQGVVREVEGFARRQPAVFLGGALALGVLASRFLKASPNDTSTDAAHRYDSHGRA